MNNTRKIGKRIYFLWNAYASKREAKIVAKTIRHTGYARIIKSGHLWQIWRSLK